MTIRRLPAILIADMAGLSALTGRDEEGIPSSHARTITGAAYTMDGGWVAT